jgi:hypothetical protein
MYPTQHVVLTAVATVPLFRRGWRWPAVALFAATAVLIDVDHYASYALRTGDLSLEQAYAYHHARATKGGRGFRPHWPAMVYEAQRPLHTLLTLLVLCLAALRWPVIAPVAAGAVFHRLLDYLWDLTSAPHS